MCHGVGEKKTQSKWTQTMRKNKNYKSIYYLIFLKMQALLVFLILF